jgi:imidazolonepropionase-like amidohydrolase
MPQLLLRNATLWDGVRLEPRTGMDVVIDGPVIREVRPTSARVPGEDASIVELDGAFLMPGLIDMHVHLVWSGSPDPARVVEEEGAQLTTVRAVANLQAEVHAGITTVRDLGGNWDLPITLARAVEHGYIAGPRIVAAGRTIIMTGGHDPFWGIPSDGPTAVMRAVRRQVSLGAGVIKVAATGGVYGRPEGEEIGQVELTYEELAAAASEAHRFGLRVAAHALGAEGIRNAVRAGIDTIEHGNFLDEALVAEMRQRGTALCPTLLIYRTIADGAGGRIPSYATEKACRAVEAHRHSFQLALEAGIPIVAGTDAGSCSTPHPALIGELQVMHAYGMPVEQVLCAATSTAARVLGRADMVGTVEAGRRADLLILDASPLEELARLHRARHIIRSGQLLAAGPGSRDTSHTRQPAVPREGVGA